MKNRSETPRKAYGYKAGEKFRCSGCMFHTVQTKLEPNVAGISFPQVVIDLL